MYNPPECGKNRNMESKINTGGVYVQKAIKKDDAIRQNDVDSFHVPGSRCGSRNTLSE